MSKAMTVDDAEAALRLAAIEYAAARRAWCRSQSSGQPSLSLRRDSIEELHHLGRVARAYCDVMEEQTEGKGEESDES